MKELLYDPKNVWEGASESLKNDIMDFGEGYKAFLNNGKTERKCVKEAITDAEKLGFVDITSKDKLFAGDKIYAQNRNKNVIFAVVGSAPICDGVNIIASHIDSPRLDLKPVPVFEEGGIAYFKTHYYGGIKKYQWTAMPLYLSGVVCTKTGDIEVEIGDKDMCLCVSDLLPHLADEQMRKPAKDAIEGEKLNLITGSIPSDCENDKFKTTILKILNDKYGMVEEDFISAEFEAYPAYDASDVGIDRSLIGSYGQDDRVCAYTSLKGIFEIANPEKTAVCILADKEEVGSMGATGMKSRFFENILAEIIYKHEENYSDIFLKRCLSNSVCLSADVSAAYDPAYDSAFEKKNTPYLNKGLVVVKYTGSRGKGGSSDATAEFVGKIRNILNDNDVVWQTGELGKIDAGGGGTVAQFIANLNVDVIDCGVALLSMHSPFEIAAKADIYMAYKGYKAFYMSK